MARRLSEAYRGKNQFGLKVSEELYICGKNQKWLAEQCGVTTGYISQLVLGHVLPSIEISEKIASVLNLDAKELRRLALKAS